MNIHPEPILNELILAARSAMLQLDGDLFAIKQSYRVSDGSGSLQPFDRRSLDCDDRRWIEAIERRVNRLNMALVPFGAALDNPASH